ncbi:MAG: 50S ribosomal protein L11 [Candidatus Nanoarchaeia archaeon]
MLETISLIVKGGQANAGPPIGPALAGKGIDIKQVVSQINQKTSEMQGIDVPVKIIIDSAKKTFELEIGLPSVAALLIKEAKLTKGSSASNIKTVGALRMPQIIKIAKIKTESGKNLKKKVLEVLGTCKSLGIIVDSKNPKDVTKEVKEGKYDDLIKSERTTLTLEEENSLKEEQAKIAEELAKIEAAEKAAAAAEAGKTGTSSKAA